MPRGGEGKGVRCVEAEPAGTFPGKHLQGFSSGLVQLHGFPYLSPGCTKRGTPETHESWCEFVGSYQALLQS